MTSVDGSPAAPAQAARGEHWWPVALAIVAVAVLHLLLPAKYPVNPAWVLPTVLLGLLAAMIVGDPGRIDRQKTWLRILTGVVIACLTLANLLAAARAHHPDAKLLMMTEAAVSLALATLVIARAINILA
jgi:hypothetical protein